MTGGGVSAPTITNPTNFTSTSFTSSGLNAVFDQFGKGTLNISENPAMARTLSDYRKSAMAESSAYGGLLNTVKPGFSQFRQAGLDQIGNARSTAMSNLSDTMAQRRVLGSSFAANQFSQTEADFAQKSADFVAQSYLAELDASSKLTQQEFAAAQKSYTAALQQFNLEGAIGADMASKNTQVMASIAETQAQLQLQASEFNAQMKAQEMAGIGSLFGSVLGMFGGGGMSDRRLKENIVRVGTTAHGLPLYHFDSFPASYEGVMADDVLEVAPEAVFVHEGYYGVRYDMLGIELRRL